MSVVSPTVFIATDLPPAFGPVTTSVVADSGPSPAARSPIERSSGTASAGRLEGFAEDEADVAGLDEPEGPALADVRDERAGLQREPRDGRGRVEPAERADAGGHVVAVVAGVGGHLAEDPLDLPRPLDLGLADLVVEVQHGRRLDEDRLARGGHVVDEPLDLPLGLGADGDHGAPAAHRRLALRRPAGRDGRPEGRVEGLAEPAVELRQPPCEVREVRARVVADVPALVDRPPDPVLEGLQHDDLLGDDPQPGRLELAGVEKVVDEPDGREDAPERPEVGAVDERALGPEPGEDGADVVGRAERERVVEPDERRHLAGPPEPALDLGDVGRRPERGEPLGPVGRPRVVEQAGADGVEAQSGLGVGRVERDVGHGGRTRQRARSAPRARAERRIHTARPRPARRRPSRGRRR